MLTDTHRKGVHVNYVVFSCTMTRGVRIVDVDV